MLRLSNLDPPAPINRVFESMGVGLALLRVNAKPVASAPFHWMLSSGRKPPLDVAFDSLTGSFAYLKFILQDEVIESRPIKIRTQEQDGIPKFDVSDWRDGRYIQDERGEIDVVFNGADLHLLRRGYLADDSVRMGDSLLMLFSRGGIFSGIVFERLNEVEVASLVQAGAL